MSMAAGYQTPSTQKSTLSPSTLRIGWVVVFDREIEAVSVTRWSFRCGLRRGGR
jgi:hypothetical protein